jgi:hypothetical protein
VSRYLPLDFNVQLQVLGLYPLLTSKYPDN